jgi:hypothetical protein
MFDNYLMVSLHSDHWPAGEHHQACSAATDGYTDRWAEATGYEQIQVGRQTGIM